MGLSVKVGSVSVVDINLEIVTLKSQMSQMVKIINLLAARVKIFPRKSVARPNQPLDCKTVPALEPGK